MKTMKAKSIDCFVCDLPYGQMAEGLPVHRDKNGPCSIKQPLPWDVKIDLAVFWDEVRRLRKNKKTPILMFCSMNFAIDLINSNRAWFRHDLVWNKVMGTAWFRANTEPMKSHEMVLVFSEIGAYYKRIDEPKCPVSVLTIPKKRGQDSHPTAKPKELYQWLLRRYCPAGGTVLDPTFGSGNALIVAKELGLHPVGIEKDNTYFWRFIKKIIG
jgi:site-specific DNA-methyltransferase (adenine-specific)